MENVEKSNNQEIRSKAVSWGVLDIKRLVSDEKRLNVEKPDFQREDIWDGPRKSRLIESIIKGIPIPSLYLAMERDKNSKIDKYITIDGQQRINAIVEFMDDKLRLSGKDIEKDLMGKRYNNIKGMKELSYRFHEAKIPVIIIDTDDPELKYEIFSRLNTGGMQLNAQEIRNCMFHGNYNDLIKKLSKNEIFNHLIAPTPSKRMKNVELVLRFFAFHKLGRYIEDDYKPPMKRFLNEEMKNHQNLKTAEIDTREETFEKTVELVKEVFGEKFGEKAFKKFDIGTDKDPDGKWGKQLNTGLFDVVMCGISQYAMKEEEENTIIKYKDIIYEELLYLMTADNEFIEGIGNKNYEKLVVKTRFNKFFDSLNKITKTHDADFSLELKKKFYDKDDKCCICNKEIKEIDDAVINMEEYWKRGKEIPISARLAHRYCYKMHNLK